MTINHLVREEKTVVNLHSPPEAVVERLVAQYATGSLGSGMNVLMASLLTYNSGLRREYDNMVAVQGVMLDDMEPVALSNSAFDDVLSRLDDGAASPKLNDNGALSSDQGHVNYDLPRALQTFFDQDLSELKWRFSYPGVQHVRLPVGDDNEDVRLLKIKPGRAAPRHTHKGFEATLVLRGAFRDGGELFERGDISIANTQVDHRPIAEGAQDCYCLAVTTGPLRITDSLRRLVRDFFA